jgi:hypothetical protein
MARFPTAPIVEAQRFFERNENVIALITLSVLILTLRGNHWRPLANTVVPTSL